MSTSIHSVRMPAPVFGDNPANNSAGSQRLERAYREQQEHAINQFFTPVLLQFFQRYNVGGDQRQQFMKAGNLFQSYGNMSDFFSNNNFISLLSQVMGVVNMPAEAAGGDDEDVIRHTSTMNAAAQLRAQIPVDSRNDFDIECAMTNPDVIGDSDCENETQNVGIRLRMGSDDKAEYAYLNGGVLNNRQINQVAQRHQAFAAQLPKSQGNGTVLNVVKMKATDVIKAGFELSKATKGTSGYAVASRGSDADKLREKRDEHYNETVMTENRTAQVKQAARQKQEMAKSMDEVAETSAKVNKTIEEQVEKNKNLRAISGQ